MQDCFACEALQGSFGDSFDYINDTEDNNPQLASPDLPTAAMAWLTYLQQKFPYVFEEDFQGPDASMETPEEFYILDLVLELLHRAAHPLFAPLPTWMPTPLVQVARTLALCLASRAQDEKEAAIQFFIHDRLVPPDQWLICDMTMEIQALNLTSKQMSLLTQQVFKPILLGTDERLKLLSALHTCQQ